jgi:hypothetical protein
VDDLIIAGPSASAVDQLKRKVLQRFKGRDLGPASAYLGITVSRDPKEGTITISQPQHAASIIQKLGMETANPRQLPLSPTDDLSAAKKDSEVEDEQLLDPQHKTLYLECVGALLYITNVTRPDLAFSVSALARRCSEPCKRHFGLLKSVVRYLVGTQQMGLTYSDTSSITINPDKIVGYTDCKKLVGYTDSDFAGCKDTRRSRGGYVFLLGGAAVLWSSKMQQAVAKSTAEAEYMAAASAASMAAFLKRIAHFLGTAGSSEPIPLRVDNQAALFMVSNSAEQSRVKHIDISHHFIRDLVARHLVRVTYVHTADNVADIFTKPLAGDKFFQFRHMLGMSK